MKKFTLSGFADFFKFKDLSFENSGESSFKLDFSKEKLKGKVSSNQSSSKGISSLILLLILFLFSNFLSAQVITVDGLTSDWSNNPSVKHVQDPFGNGVVDNQFTEGSKDFLPAIDLSWVIGQTKAKNDIANGGFGIANQVKYVDINNITQTLNGSYLVFAGDRTSNNGDAQIGFWFYLNSTAPVTVSGNRYFAPPHVRGDLLVLADFTGGGRIGTVKVYRWIGGGIPTPGSVVVDNTNGNLETTTIASVVAENNSGTPNVPIGWNFLSAKYKTNEFYEGFVDLGAIGGNINFTCSATVLLETRSSQSITASLDDFIGSTLGEVPTVTVNSPTICAGVSSTITATPLPAGVYTYAWTVPPGASNPGNVASFSATIAGSYSVIVTTQAGCPSSPGLGNLTNYPVTPDNTASGMVCVGSKFTYESTQYDPGTYNIPRTDANGCSWKTVLTVSNYPVTPDNTASGMVCVGFKFTYESTQYDPGTYNITRTDANGCAWKTVLTVTNYPVTPDNTASGMVCVGSKFTYEGIEYLPGTYNIARTDANGCAWKTVLTVSNYPVTQDNTASGTVCVGSKFTYEGIEYLPGTYNIARTDANGCSWKTVLTVTNYPVTPDNTASGMVCAGFKYTYEGKEYGPGSYDIARTDQNGCAWKTVLTVTENPLPVCPTDISASTTVLCGATKEVAQTNTDTEFLAWLAGFTPSASYNSEVTSYVYDLGTVKSDNGDGPKNPISGATAKVTVTWTLTDKVTSCKNTCSATFTVSNGCTIICDNTKTGILCLGDETGTITVNASKGTPPYTIELFKDGNLVALDTKMGNTEPSQVVFENLPAGQYSYVVTDDYQVSCNNNEPIVIEPGTPCGAHCTYTQGYYGNLGGKSCADGVSYSTVGLIAKALDSYPSDTMIIGLPGRSVSMSNNATDIAKIVQVLPGGGSSVALSSGDFLITSMPASYLKKGNINNTLFAQTITLGLNLGIDSTLGNFVLQVGKLAIASPEGGCGSNIPKTRSCSYDIYTPTINEYKYYDMPAVVGLLPTKTVQGLFDMANIALGGGVLPAGITLSNLASAVDLINNAFDECRISMGYNQTPLTCVSDRAAFNVNPVPELIDATITYKFSYVSDVTTEVWNMSGVKLHTQFDTNSYYDKKVLINYPFTASGSYIIKIKTNIGSSSRVVIKK